MLHAGNSKSTFKMEIRPFLGWWARSGQPTLRADRGAAKAGSGEELTQLSVPAAPWPLGGDSHDSFYWDGTVTCKNLPIDCFLENSIWIAIF